MVIIQESHATHTSWSDNSGIPSKVKCLGVGVRLGLSAPLGTWSWSPTWSLLGFSCSGPARVPVVGAHAFSGGMMLCGDSGEHEFSSGVAFSSDPCGYKERQKTLSMVAGTNRSSPPYVLSGKNKNACCSTGWMQARSDRVLATAERCQSRSLE